jgi:2-polyprenyl-3-methyl-5-hydroxy-6-metoxy-1,4-benzoquinol methylase
MLKKETNVTNENYIFSSDHDAEMERLKRLNEMYNENTLSFLLERIKPYMNVLEIGCGNGEISRRLAAAASDIKYTGVDMTEEGVKECQEAATSESLQYVVGDITKLEESPVSLNKYDVIFLRWVLAYIPEAQMKPAIEKMFSLLADNGLLVLEECDVYACYAADKNGAPIKVQAFDDWMTLTKEVDEQLNANFRLGSLISSIAQETLNTEVSTRSFQSCFNTTYAKQILSLGLQSASTFLVNKDIISQEAITDLRARIHSDVVTNELVNINYIDSTICAVEKNQGFIRS